MRLPFAYRIIRPYMTPLAPTTDSRRGRKPSWPRIRRIVEKSGTISFRVDAGKFAGRARFVKQFPTAEEAEKFAALLRSQRAAEAEARKFEAVNRAVSLTKLTDRQRADVLDALKILEGTDGTLAGCASFWKQHAAPATARTARQVLDELVAACQRANRRERTVAELEMKLGTFCSFTGEAPIARATAHDVSTWLDERSKGLSPRSRAAYRQALHRLFGYAVKRGYRSNNPVAAIERPSLEETTPEVFTVQEVRALLARAQEVDPRMVPYYAIGLFAGLRTENELARLDWRMVNLTRRTITVSPETAKKRRSRVVEVSSNLVAWLNPHQQDAGPIFFSRRAHRRILETARHGKPLRWPRNVMRHSFASYHLVAHDDAGKTAMQLGHPHGVEVLFKSYRAIVEKEDALNFWKISPTPTAVLKFPIAVTA